MLRRKNSGFTLVEILIVVIILGILAAIVIPQFTGASEDARRNGLSSQLQTLRSQIELYKMQHHDQLPDLAGANGWQLLTARTTDLHALDTAGACGPYLQAVPVNPLNNRSALEAGTPTWNNATGTWSYTPTGTVGFVYDYGAAGAGTGKIWGTDAAGTALFQE